MTTQIDTIPSNHLMRREDFLMQLNLCLDCLVFLTVVAVVIRVCHLDIRVDTVVSRQGYTIVFDLILLISQIACTVISLRSLVRVS